MIATRTLVFRAKLSLRTHASLEAFLEEMRHLWNGALEERMDAYRKASVSISWVDQFKSLTEIRRALPDYACCSVAAQRSVLKRLDRAFQAFFRRVAAGQTPGFPRFRSLHRSLRSFEVPAPVIRRQGRWNVVAVKGIGKFRFLGEIEGTPKILRIVKTALRVAVQVVVEREAPDLVDLRPRLGIDLGIRSRIALSSEETVPGRRLDRSTLIQRQRALSRAKARQPFAMQEAPGDGQGLAAHDTARARRPARADGAPGARTQRPLLCGGLEDSKYAAQPSLGAQHLGTELGDICAIAYLQSGRSWWVGAQGAPASHVPVVLGLRRFA